MEQNYQVQKLSLHYQYKYFNIWNAALIHTPLQAASKLLTIFDQSKNFEHFLSQTRLTGSPFLHSLLWSGKV